MTSAEIFAARLATTRARLDELGIDGLIVSVGADLPYLTGYHAMPLERLTMLVVTAETPAQLIVPGLEAARVERLDDLFELVTWGETDDPIAHVSAALGNAARDVAVGDTTWARFVVELLSVRPELRLRRGTEVMKPLREVKDAAEIDALQRAAAAADRVQDQLRTGVIALEGRTESAVQADIAAALLAAGHDEVNFVIVASGPNAASPHHEVGDRVIVDGDNVLFDIGGTLDGYCSDITRCVHLGPPPAEFAELYDVLFAAQAAGVAAATVGTPAEEVDRAARAVIDGAGFGEYFIHRTGHGIGMEAHEEPYIVEGNTAPLAAGHAFSVEPGIYVPGMWGARLEDIVVATDDGPLALNRVDHRLGVLG